MTTGPFQTPVAIVGIGGAFPGCAHLDEFWASIRDGVDHTSDCPPGRWILPPEQAYSKDAGRLDHVYSKRACFLDPFPLDDTFFDGLDIDPATCRTFDPMVHVALRAARDAVHDAGLPQYARNRTGLIIGNIALPTDSTSTLADWLIGRTAETALFRNAGLPSPEETRRPTAAKNRHVMGRATGILAQALGLGGGHYAIDAACASSLYAIALAVEDLRTHRADAMLAGGVSRPDSLFTQMGFSQLGALSRRGACAAFDARADGLVVGEGAGIVVLKRLDDAVAQNDFIYGVIRGIGLSNDVDGDLLAPNQEGQLRALRTAYQNAGWAPTDVELIECHATGTPIGDATEVGSLRRLWEEAGWTPGSGQHCVLGSVKTNIGHLLTGAGAAGLIKVLLAFKHQTLPPVAHFETAHPRLELDQSPFRVLRKSETWPSPRRAAVSAFGFGGTNAHLLLERFPAPGAPPPSLSSRAPEVSCVRSSSPVAIIGWGGQLGPWKGKAALKRRFFADDLTTASPAPQARFLDGPAGFFIDALDVPFGDFRIPPKELEEILPQQTLMLQAAAEAVHDAGLRTESSLRTGVFIGIGLDLGTTNAHVRWSIRSRASKWARELGTELHGRALEEWVAQLCDAVAPPLNPNRTMGGLGGIVASRIARELGLGGPAFALSSEETSGYSALEAAVRTLQAGHIDAAVVGAVDIQSDRRHAGLPHLAERCLTDGALALVLRRACDLSPTDDRRHTSYAQIVGLGATTAPREDDGGESNAYSAAIQRAIKDAELESLKVNYVETNTATASARAVERDALRQAFSPDVPPCLESQEWVGDAGAVSSLVGITRAALALHNRWLPGPDGARPWLASREPRRAGVSSHSLSGHFAHVILEERDGSPGSISEPPECPSLVAKGHHFFSFEDDSPEALIKRLERFRAILADQPPIAELERGWAAEHPTQPNARLGAAVVATSLDDLCRAIEQVHRAVEMGEGLQHRGRWSAHYAPNPLGPNAKVAFVYPGSGNQFANMGRAHAFRFPNVLRTQEAEFARLSEQLCPDLIWNGKAIERASPRDLIVAQVALGTFLTDLLTQFSITPEAAIGYSLGESTALFSLGAWAERETMLERTLTSPLFTSELAGSFDAARRHWKLDSDDAPVTWSVGVINCPAAIVQDALAKHERAYLLIINTPGECVIGGDERAVAALVEELDRHFIPLSGITSVHCEVAEQAAGAYRAHHLLPTTPPKGIQFYSGARARPYEVNADSAADAILDQALEGIDFPRLMSRVWEDGYRVFVEIGPGGSCTRMIRSIFGDRHYVATPICASGEGIGSLATTLAQLTAERVPVDPAPWFKSLAPAEPRASTRPCLHIPVGLQPLNVGSIVPPVDEESPPMKAGPVRRQRATPASVEAPVSVPAEPGSGVVRMQSSAAGAHDAFLRLTRTTTDVMSAQAAFHLTVTEHTGGVHTSLQTIGPASTGILEPIDAAQDATGRPAYGRQECLSLATGRLSDVWGPAFAEVDDFPSRVRLPDEPLMLVDRIMRVEGEPRSLGPGRIITEHDVGPGAWYLDGNRIPTSIAVEAGQADLILSGYLGIDFETRGESVYRLLDATVTFHDHLPGPGEIIRYDIRIDRFLDQGDTWLFWFRFDASVNDQPLLTMRNGCAGFFSPEELAAGAGIMKSALDLRAVEGLAPEGNGWFAPAGSLSLDSGALDRLRAGDLSVLSEHHDALHMNAPLTLPSERLRLIDRVTTLEPEGGRFGLGRVRAEADIHPDDWFLTCHFVDDRVMPGTLMYESTLQALRVLLLRAGWIAEKQEGVVFEPKPKVASRLRCRGQVLPDTRMVTYEVSIKEVGFEPHPYVIADALMYADGKPIVEIGDMSVQLAGVTRADLQETWSATHEVPVSEPSSTYDHDRILAFAIGKPSEAFGPPYRPFDHDRRIARLPGPPFLFLDRITQVEGAPFQLKEGAACEAQYWVDPESWYFGANRQEQLPFAVLLEAALQPCGWLAAYTGSALTSEEDLKFRNLGGEATLHRDVFAGDQLHTRVRMTQVSNSLGMIIQHYDLDLRNHRAESVYQGKTYFGFFGESALANQVGLTDANLSSIPSTPNPSLRQMPLSAPFPQPKMRMVDRIDVFEPDGGEVGLGFIRGSIDVDPEAWFFAAHFYQDPVWPGSLGLEAFLQVLKVAVVEKYALPSTTQFQTMPLGHPHRWTYRGQVVPADTTVTVEATIQRIEDRAVYGSGFLSVDGRIIYQIEDFGVSYRV